MLCYILEKSSILQPENFPAELFASPKEILTESINSELTLSQVRNQEMSRIERIYLDQLLKKHFGKINITAKAAGITTRQLHKLMTKHNLKKEAYKTKKLLS
ncbi:MAG: hypothetical protein HUK40_19295 [Desulfobacter sp.]|nr:hypothetical protein [Desulfobacter sp.]WDP86254.1 MAG: hypothetical protein HUN05_14890 [Desulfobacter sp.]